MTTRRRHAIIVDDERLARRELRTLLEESHGEQVRVVGEAGTVADAARIAHATDADVVFLDIQLAGEMGMDLLPLLGADVDVVFVTAHDAFTIRAFEVNALDYLLKPVAPERLAVTVSRLAAAQPPAPTRETLTYEDRLFLRLGEERAFVRVRDIVNLESVERLEPWSHASQHVYLRGLAEPMIMSRRFGARLRERFG